MANLLEKTKVKTVASALVDALVEQGVNRIFGYPGASVLSIYNELSKENTIKHYLVRHEQAAVHAAEGYARVSGNTGVVLVTSGPGFTNTITGIANAYADSTPLVILAGDVANSNKNGKVFQNVDIASVVETCSKKTFTLLREHDVKDVISKAFEEAQSGVKGPVVVILPRNILESNYNEAVNKVFSKKEEKFIDYSTEIERLKNLIKNSKRPLVLAGGGCIDASEELFEFVKRVQIPVVSTLMGIGVFPSENNLYLGMIGQNGVGQANGALHNCDLLIAFGAAFSDRSTCKNERFSKKCRIVSVNINAEQNEYDLNITADVKEFLSRLNLSIADIDTKEFWVEEIDNIKTNFSPYQNMQYLQASYVLAKLSEYTKKYEPMVVTDVGQHQMLTAQFFNFNKPRKFITSGGLGTMGFGLPASIGAHIANPESLILNITGDGSFQMNLQELATCREHNIPVKIIILNNGYLGMVRQMQERIYQSRYQVEMINPDFTKIAEAYDLFAVRVNTKEELILALEKAINHKGTAIIDVMIDAFENI